MKSDKVKENWSNLPIIIRILFILLIIAFIYDLITGYAFSIFFSVCFILLIIAELYYWFTNKKEE